MKQCFPKAKLAVVFCPPGKWTSTPAPPPPPPQLVAAFVADPSVDTWIHASCGYLSAVIARVRDCFTVSPCVSPPEREGTVVWTLMSVTSVTQGSDVSGWKKESVLWGQPVVNLAGQLLTLMNKTASCQPVLGKTLQPGFRGMVWHEPEPVCLHRNFGVPPLTERLDSSLTISVIGVDRTVPVIRRSAWFWTLSRACWLAFAVVDHAVELYSIWGLTVPWYTVFSIISLAAQVVPAGLRRIASLRLAFTSAVAMCGFQVFLPYLIYPVVWLTVGAPL